ncbi:MAG: DUF1176 domain-containing protein [Rhizobiales bacterium]|nr:DUF1176 domain-containing protein [Hyphomicrobiales bacterium]
MPFNRSFRAALTLALMGFTTNSASAATGIRTFDNWLVGCDNTLTCRAIGTMADETDAGSYVVLDRAAGPGATATLRFVRENTPVGDAQGLVLRVDTGAALTLAGSAFRAIEQESDDKPEASELVEPTAVTHALEAMGQGRALRFGKQAPAADAPAVSLAGLAAALRFIDEAQGRQDTVTALLVRGSKSASAVPAAPAMPVLAVVVPNPTRAAPAAVPRALIQRHIRETRDDDCDLGNRAPSGRVIRLSNSTLLYEIGCWRAASQSGSMFYLGSDTQPANASRVDFETLDAETGRLGRPIQALTSASGLEEMSAATLSSLHKDRGAGDCGTAASWVWTGRAFRLSSYATMPVCKGVPPEDWITLWRTGAR